MLGPMTVGSASFIAIPFSVSNGLMVCDLYSVGNVHFFLVFFDLAFDCTIIRLRRRDRREIFCLFFCVLGVSMVIFIPYELQPQPASVAFSTTGKA